MARILDDKHIMMTESEFDEMVSRVMENGRSPTWFPNLREADELCDKVARKYEYILWLCETITDVELDDEQRSARKKLRSALSDALRFRKG